MIKITQLKLPIEHKKEDLERKVCKLLQMSPSKLYGIEILKRSLDARKTPLMYNYQMGVFADGEEKIVKKIKNKDVSLGNLVKYHFPKFYFPIVDKLQTVFNTLIIYMERSDLI